VGLPASRRPRRRRVRGWCPARRRRRCRRGTQRLVARVDLSHRLAPRGRGRREPGSPRLGRRRSRRRRRHRPRGRCRARGALGPGGDRGPRVRLL
ncbi:MAG: hypothetical protein AVDCRST_MAG54-867, partial [uncultured Actinomycetospora sp.]